MKLTHQPPAWLRRVPRPPGGHALLAVFASPLAADSISQVLHNTTLWIIGILAGLATLMLTLGGVRYLMANGEIRLTMTPADADDTDKMVAAYLS